MIYLMSDIGATVAMFVLLILFIVILFLKISLFKKIAISIIVIFLLIFIPIIGHSNWNKKTRLSYELNHLNTSDFYAPSTNLKTIKEIINLKHPLRIMTVSSVRQPFEGGTLLSDEIVDINGQRYNITLVCYLYPLNFTPYETWVINNITKNK